MLKFLNGIVQSLMNTTSSQTKTIFLSLGALMGWIALILQLYLSITNRITSLPESLIRYFTYFTILTNMLVAFSFTMQWLAPHSKGGRFFSLPQTSTAITVYIIVVGVTYNLLLRSVWDPQGLQKIVDELLHTVIPLFATLYWILFVSRSALQWKNVLPWAIYPLAYFIVILIRGAFSGYYPYPFIDVNKLGYNGAIFNSVYLFTAFMILSLIMVGITKMRSKNV